MKPKKLIITGAIIFLIGMLFGLIETFYFLAVDGWHVLPSNYEEQWCDFLTYSLTVGGGGLMVIGLGKLINTVEID